MNNKKICIKNIVHYICIIFMISFGVITIVASGGVGSDNPSNSDKGQIFG